MAHLTLNPPHPPDRHLSLMSCSGSSSGAGLGSWVHDTSRDLVEVFSNFAVHVIAESTKISVLSIAHKLNGFCHTHLPCADLVEGCAYCARRGNCFSSSAMPPKPDTTLLDEFQEKLAVLLEDFADKIVQELEKDAVPAEKAREMIKAEIQNRFRPNENKDE